MVLISELQLSVIKNRKLPPPATIDTFAINNSRFWNLFHRFDEVISALVINGGRVKILRLFFFDIRKHKFGGCFDIPYNI